MGLIGANGAGKSVLLRLILGREQPTNGEIKIGPSVKVGYYAQEHDTLDFNQTLIDAVRLAGNMSESNAVSFLIRYLFSYQQATQRIGSLSGGERSRLQLALLVLSGANFLLLDEPTNNLDIASAEVLENALNDFNGTVLVISHDRYFLDRTVNRIFALENGSIPNTSADTATTPRRLESTSMGRKQAEALRYDRACKRRKPDGLSGVCRSKLAAGVRWYNFRPYVPRTFNSKITDLPHLRNAPERKCHTMPGLWHGTHRKSRDKIEKSRNGHASQPHA